MEGRYSPQGAVLHSMQFSPSRFVGRKEKGNVKRKYNLLSLNSRQFINDD